MSKNEYINNEIDRAMHTSKFSDDTIPQDSRDIPSGDSYSQEEIDASSDLTGDKVEEDRHGRKKKKSIFRQELDRDYRTFSRLHGKDRLRFIWDYFRYKIIAAIIILVIVGIFANLLYQGQKPYRLRVCVVLNNDLYCDQWFDSFIEDLMSDGAEGDVDVNQDQPFDYDNTYYNVQELEVMTTVSSMRMDVAICGPDMYSYLLSLNACMPLDTVLSTEEVDSLLSANMLIKSTANEKINEDGSVDDSESVEGYFAIDLSDTAFGEEYNGEQELEDGEDPAPLYAVIISNTRHLDDSLTLLRSIVKE